MNKHKKALKDGEKADPLRTWQPKAQHKGEFPGFSFASYIPDVELKKSVLEMPKRANKERPTNKRGKSWPYSFGEGN